MIVDKYDDVVKSMGSFDAHLYLWLMVAAFSRCCLHSSLNEGRHGNAEGNGPDLIWGDVIDLGRSTLKSCFFRWAHGDRGSPSDSEHLRCPIR